MAKNPVGRPPHEASEATRKQVQSMAGFGLTEADISAVLGISDRTLRKYYAEELATGHLKANVQVAQSLFRKATGDGSQAVTAAIFWMKTRAGWKETVVTENTHTHHDVSNRPLSEDEWAEEYPPLAIQ